MKRTWFTLIVILMLSQFVFAQLNEKFSLFERSVILNIDSIGVVYDLPDSFLIKGSASIFLNSKPLLEGKDYNIDYVTGKINFLKPYLLGKEIKLFYKILPCIRIKY